MKLIVGLGNPGMKYVHTRHNFGARVVESLARSHATGFTKHGSLAKIAAYTVNGKKHILILPTTYMNESGPGVAEIARFYKIRPGDVIVIYDDLDLPFGTIRVSRNTSSGGHNGIKSIIQALGSSEFVRVRLGIGPNLGSAENFVLEKWNATERKKVPDILTEAQGAVTMLLSRGLTATANTYN